MAPPIPPPLPVIIATLLSMPAIRYKAPSSKMMDVCEPEDLTNLGKLCGSVNINRVVSSAKISPQNCSAILTPLDRILSEKEEKR